MLDTCLLGRRPHLLSPLPAHPCGRPRRGQADCYDPFQPLSRQGGAAGCGPGRRGWPDTCRRV